MAERTPIPATTDGASSGLLAPVLAILNEPTAKPKRSMVVRKDGSCYWQGNHVPWRKPASNDAEEALSVAWRPLSSTRSVIAIGYSSYVILCDVPPPGADSNFSALERRIALPLQATHMCWSPRGRGLLVASSASRSAVSIDAAFGEIDGSFTPGGIRSSIYSISWSIAGYLFVSSGPAPTFRIFSGENLALIDTWICKSLVKFGEWSADGCRFMCGNETDGILIVDVRSKQQWLVLSPEELRQLAKEYTGSDGDFRIKAITWDPNIMDTVAILFDNAHKIAYAKLVLVGKLMKVSTVPAYASESVGVCACIRFHPTSRDSILLAVEGEGALVEIKTIPKA